MPEASVTPGSPLTSFRHLRRVTLYAPHCTVLHPGRIIARRAFTRPVNPGAKGDRRLRRENRQLRLEREILSKAAAWFARETNAIPPKGFRFVSDHQADYPIATMCRVLGVSSSGYHAWSEAAIHSHFLRRIALHKYADILVPQDEPRGWRGYRLDQLFRSNQR